MARLGRSDGGRKLDNRARMVHCLFRMSAASPPPAEQTDGLDGWERTLLDRQLEALGRLAEMGMAIAGAIERRGTVEGANSGAELHHAAMDFARVSRAVRLTYALQSSLIAEFKGARSRRAGPAAPDEDADEGPMRVIWDEPPGEDERRQVRLAVRRLAVGAAMDKESVERLVREAAERLERDDFAGVLNRPVGEIVAMICADLGLEPDWDRLAGEDWAKAEIAAATPGSPFAAFKAGPARAPPFVPSG
jgi:hypothetical protein